MGLVLYLLLIRLFPINCLDHCLLNFVVVNGQTLFLPLEIGELLE